MKEKWPSFNLVLTYFLILSLITIPFYKSGGKLLAQNVNCDEILNEAEDIYRQGQFDKAIALITVCLEDPGITSDQKQRAYRLMGLTYLAKDHLTDARNSIRKLLELVPNYQPDPIYDPPPFVKIVEEVKSETVVETVEIVEKKDEKKSSKKWWWIGGGGLIAATAVVLAIIATNGDDDEKYLPEPPGRP